MRVRKEADMFYLIAMLGLGSVGGRRIKQGYGALM